MPINFIQQRKKQKYLALILIAAFVITAVILWFGYFRKSKPVSGKVPISSYIEEIKIDFNVLDSPFLQESQVFEKTPSFEGETGRDNPFLPY